MRIQPMLLVLTLVNLALVTLGATQLHGAAAANDPMPVLRARALEIVDAEGRVRASIAVYPPTRQASGEVSSETVLLRLITERGRPSVKIGASEQSAGLALVGPTGTNATWVRIGAAGTVSTLTLKNEDGRERVVTP